MNVSVQVIARTILTVDSQPAAIEVTAADVARGYIDIPQAVAFHVRSNAPHGYMMQFEALGYPFRRADVSWGNAAATVGMDRAWLAQPYQKGTTTGTLTVRLTVAPDAAPGSYDWPIRLSAGSL